MPGEAYNLQRHKGTVAAEFSTFILDIGILTIAALLFSFLLARLGLPEVSGQIIAGTVVGPYVLKLVSSFPVISALSQLGIILLMFVIGLELDVSEMRTMLARVGGIALIEVAVSFSVLFAFVYLFTGNDTVALIVAVALSFTSTAIVGRLVIDNRPGSRRRLPEYRKTLLGVLVLEDVAAIVFLALIPGLSGQEAGNTVTTVALLTGGGLAFVAITYFAGRYLVPLVVEYFENVLANSRDIPFLFSLALGVIFGATATYLGFSPAIGSFLIGLALRGKYSLFVSRQLIPLHNLFVTLFFVSVGAQIDPSSALSTPLLLIAILIVALSAKYLGGYLSSRLAGAGIASGVFALWLLPRAEFSLVIAQAARTGGVLSVEFYSVIGIAVIISALLGPFLLSRAGELSSQPTASESGDV